MKTFAIIVESPYKTGLKQFIKKIRVFEIKKNKPSLIGFTEVDTQCMKGFKDKAMDFLVDEGYLPKHCEGKYYFDVNRNFVIYELN